MVATEAVVTAAPLVTAEELLQLPSGEFRYELIAGELKQMAPAGYDHGRIGMRIAGPLNQYVEANGLGEVSSIEAGFKISQDPDTVRVPDVAFVRTERVPQQGTNPGFFLGAPDIAIEVVSPGDTLYEVESKTEVWLDAGAVEVWIVNPKQRTVTIRRASSVVVLRVGDDLDGGDLIPGFRLAIAAISR